VVFKSALFLSVSIFVSSTFAESYPTFVKPQHRATLNKYLTQHPGLIIAPEALCRCESELARLRTQEVVFQPYYAVGDINDDQVEDFAVALLDGSKPVGDKPEIAVVIFHGPFAVEKANKGIVVIKHYALDRAKEVLSVFKSRVENGNRIPARLDVGPGVFGSDDVHAIAYDRKLKKYTVKYFYVE
jgi:hypothetical protein